MKNSDLFKKIVEVIQSHDVNTSRIISKELEIRKTTKILGNTKIVLK